jgi:riboflavin-specific deaminase-like protein
VTPVLTGASGDDLARLYLDADRVPHADRPWVVSNMVSTVDGAVEVDGSSKDLGGPDDLEVFRALRSVADVVLVGAGTVRAEGYGPPRLPEALTTRRRGTGRTDVPRLAIVSGRLSLDPSMPFFDGHRPYLVTTSGAAASASDELRARADLLACGTDRVDLEQALRRLRQEGASVVLSEGGPSLNGDLLAGGLVDEVCLTVDPRIVGGTGRRIFTGAGGRMDLELAHVAVSGSVLFLRYLCR